MRLKKSGYKYEKKDGYFLFYATRLLAFTTHSAYAKDINLTGIYKNEPCNISIKIVKNTSKTKYFYKIVDNNQTKSQGYISSIKSNGESGFYIKFKKIGGVYENGSIVIQKLWKLYE